jgi:hypothetical protein
VKRIIDHRRAEQESYLAARHPDLQLVDVLLVEQVALRQRRLVHAATCQ